jgi:WD40 repeat protein
MGCEREVAGQWQRRYPCYDLGLGPVSRVLATWFDDLIMFLVTAKAAAKFGDQTKKTVRAGKHFVRSRHMRVVCTDCDQSSYCLIASSPDVTDLAWAPHDRYLASVGLDSKVYIWCGLTLGNFLCCPLVTSHI